jgi:hypothetical protein
VGGDGERVSPGIPLRCGCDLLGTVALDDSRDGSFSGVFSPGPDFARYQPLFERVFELERCVDESTAGEYLAAWHDWNQSLETLEQLGLSFGDEGIPIEGLEIDVRWRMAFRPALWWLATNGGESPGSSRPEAAPEDSGDLS